MDHLTNLTLTQLSHALRDGETTSVEAAMACLSRMTAIEGDINAFITPTARQALEEASRADRLLAEARRNKAADELSPLCGIPWAAKDNLAVRGVRMTCASEMLRDFVPEYTAAACERLLDAGAPLLGKTNLDEFAMGSFCERSIVGPTRNPLDPGRSPGGSSGGSAAAVASGEAFFALGSDTGGSARQPAAFCGLVSVKPTYGLVSRRGMAELASSLDTVCPIARTVGDCAAVLEGIAGRDPGDMTTFASDGGYRAAADQDPAGLTVGILDGGTPEGCEPAVIRALERAARRLESVGVNVTPVSLPLGDALEIYLIVASAEASSNLARYDGIRYGLHGEGERTEDMIRDARTRGFGDEVKRRIVTGTYALSSTYGGGYYKKVKAAQLEVCRRTEAVLSGCDAVLLPTAAGTAFRLGSYDDDPNALYRSDRFTTVANLTGCPVIQLPGGGDGSMPVGISLMGKKHSERTLFRLAQALERELAQDVEKEVGRCGNAEGRYVGDLRRR